jgi:hypothetical protein
MQRDITACNRSRASSTIGLKDIAIDDYLALTKRFHIADTPQGTPDESLDLVGSTRWRSFTYFATNTLRGSTGQHRVLGGDPAFAGALHPTRNTLVDRSSAENNRATKSN